MAGPIDYWGDLARVDVGRMIEEGVAANRQQRAVQAMAQAQLAQQEQLAAARQRAIQNPSAANYNALLLLDPKSHEGIKAAAAAWSEDERATNLREITAIDGLLQAGQAQAAAARVQRRIDADRAAGQDTSDDEEILAAIQADPKAARLYTGSLLTGILGPEKAVEAITAVGGERRADAELPGKIALTDAQAAQAEATAGKTNAETAEVAPNAQAERGLKYWQGENFRSAIDDRVNRFNLDRDQFESDLALKFDELEAKRASGPPMSAGMEKYQADATIAAETSRSLARRATDLASRLDGVEFSSGGWGANLNQGWSRTSGKLSPMKQLRDEYDALIVSQAIKNLPPGPASDKDIQMAMKGFPRSDANREAIQSFLRGMAKLQNIAADREQGRADWISEVGSLARAPRDITVNGRRVAKGSTYADYSSAASSAEQAGDVGSRSYMRFGGQ